MFEKFKMCFVCKKDKERRMRKKIIERFDKTLDIRSFVAVYTNLSLILQLFLTQK